MYIKTILFKILFFVIVFTIIFFAIRYFNLLPPLKLQQNIASIPWLFSAISLIFSIICGFVIQSRWHMWDELIDATRGELSSFRQLQIMAHHFPKTTKDAIRRQIAKYLEVTIEETENADVTRNRSDKAEALLYELEDTIFNARKEHPESGVMGFEILRNCINYREKRIQNIAHTLPQGVKIFIISATVAIIVSSLFIGVDSLLYDYLFTLIIGILSYGIYLLIDDLDHPYRPGDWHLKADGYKQLLSDIQKKIVATD